MPAKGIVVIASATPGGSPCLDATQLASLHRVANRPIICHVFDALAAAGVRETAVLAPHTMLDEVRTCVRRDGGARTDVRYLSHDVDASPEAAMQAIADFVADSPAIVHRAEGLLGQPLDMFLGLLSNDEPDAVLLVSQGGRNAEPLRSCTQQALRLVEIDPAKAAFGLAGTCVLGQGLLSGLCSTGVWPPSMHLSPLVESIVAHGLSRPQVRVVSCWRAFTGDSMDLLAVNRAVLDELDVRGPMLAEASNRIEGQVLIDPSASVSASVISGPVIIGAGAQVANSYIGPHTSIGERALIEGAEIEHSIVFSGARIMHIGGRLVTSLVGRDARIFRDFSVPRAMRMHVGDGDEVALC